MRSGKTPRILIFDYDDYRAYLLAFYKKMKMENKSGFSYSIFAKNTGFRSASFLKLVIDGKRNLSISSIQNLSKALGHNQKESKYFEGLVLFNQATDTSEKILRLKVLLGRRSTLKSNTHYLSHAQFNYYSRWYYIAIRELIALPDFKEDSRWISERLISDISPAEVSGAISELIQLGLVFREDSGRLKQKEAFVRGEAGQMRSAIARYLQKQMIEKGSESLDRVAPEKREISSLTLGVSRAGFSAIKKEILLCKEKILEICADDSNALDEIIQVNLHLFPLTDKKRNRGDK